MSYAQRGGLAYNPPFVVPVQVMPELDEFIPLFTGYAMDCISRTASQNQARAMFKELMESDQSPFPELVQTLADLTEFCVVNENLNPNQVEPAIRNLVQVVVNGYLAMAVNAFPNEFGQVLDQRQMADVQPYIGELQKLQHAAQQFMNGGGVRGGGGGGGWGGQQQRGWQPGAGRGNVRGGGAGWNRGGGGRGGMAQARWDEPEMQQQQGRVSAVRDNWGGGGRGGYSGQQRSSGRPTIWDDTGPARRDNPTDSSFNGAGGRVRREFVDTRQQEEPRRNVQPIVSNQTSYDGAVFIPASEQKEWPKVIDLKRPWDRVLLNDGSQIRAAHLSDWKVTFDKDEPFTPWYDPQTHILFHIKSPEGIVTAQPIQREESMNYLDHELDPHLRRVAEEAERKRGGRVEAAWQMVEQLRPNPSSPLATIEPLTEDVEGATVRPINPEDYLLSSSLVDAVKRASLRLKVDRPEVLKEAFELYVDRAVLTTVIEPDFDLLNKMMLAPSYKQLFQLMMENDTNEELVAEVNKRITIGVNRALQQHMGMADWGIDDFLEDIGDLLQALKSNPAVGEQITEIFQAYAPEVISRALAHYTEEEVTKAVRTAVGLDTSEDDVMPLIWRERSTVTRMPVTSEQLRVPADTGCAVLESKQPELSKTLNSIFERSQDIPHTFYGRYIATTDGTVYSVVKGHLNDKAVLVFKADFNLQ